jgi:hypothetical protein
MQRCYNRRALAAVATRLTSPMPKIPRPCFPVGGIFRGRLRVQSEPLLIRSLARSSPAFCRENMSICSWNRRILRSATSCGASRDAHRIGCRWSSRTCASAPGGGISGLALLLYPPAATSRTMPYFSIFKSTNLPAPAGSYSVYFIAAAFRRVIGKRFRARLEWIKKMPGATGHLRFKNLSPSLAAETGSAYAACRLPADCLPVLRSVSISYEIFWPSLRLRIPARSTAEIWTNTFSYIRARCGFNKGAAPLPSSSMRHRRVNVTVPLGERHLAHATKTKHA